MHIVDDRFTWDRREDNAPQPTIHRNEGPSTQIDLRTSTFLIEFIELDGMVGISQVLIDMTNISSRVSIDMTGTSYMPYWPPMEQ